MVATSIDRWLLVFVYQGLILSRIEYALAILIINSLQIERLKKVQNVALCIILGCCRDTPCVPMRFLLHSPTVEDRLKIGGGVACGGMCCYKGDDNHGPSFTSAVIIAIPSLRRFYFHIRNCYMSLNWRRLQNRNGSSSAGNGFGPTNAFINLTLLEGRPRQWEFLSPFKKVEILAKVIMSSTTQKSPFNLNMKASRQWEMCQKFL